jgi:predicted ATPase
MGFKLRGTPGVRLTESGEGEVFGKPNERRGIYLLEEPEAGSSYQQNTTT